MAANQDISKKNLTVLAVVVGCFAVLWPKIFYPMIQSILFPADEEATVAKVSSTYFNQYFMCYVSQIQGSIRRLNFDDMIHPQMRESMGESRPADKLLRDGNRASFHPYLQQATKPQAKVAGAVNLVIPVYTIAIILFFLYSLFKMTLKKSDDSHSSGEKSVSLCQNSFCAHKYSEKEDPVGVRKEIPQDRKAQRALEQYGKDKVLTALKTIILEMEDIKENFTEINEKCNMTSDCIDKLTSCESLEEL